MSNLLLDERPLVILPSLAKKVGLEEAIVLQQLHYWLLRSNNERDGRKWVYNSIPEWQKQFPFWSEKVVRRVLDSLRDKGYVVTANYNNLPMDKTLWYSVDYEKLSTECPNGNTIRPLGVYDLPARGIAIPETTTENTSSLVVDEGYAQVVRLWQDNMPGSMTPIIADELKDLVDTYNATEVCTAIHKAVEANARNLRYVNAILRNRAAGTEPGKGTGNGRTKESARKVGFAEAEYKFPEWLQLD